MREGERARARVRAHNSKRIKPKIALYVHVFLSFLSLRSPCVQSGSIKPVVDKLVDRVRHDRGFGLSAPQIGESIQVRR